MFNSSPFFSHNGDVFCHPVDSTEVHRAAIAVKHPVPCRAQLSLTNEALTVSVVSVINGTEFDSYRISSPCQNPRLVWRLLRALEQRGCL